MRRHLKSSLANATPATDGKRVVVLFGTVGVLAAFDLDGKRALAAGRRRPRLQRPAGGRRRVGPRQLADPLRRPRDRAGRPPQGLVPGRVPAGGRRRGLARRARRAVHLGDPERAARADGRRAGDERPDDPRLRPERPASCCGRSGRTPRSWSRRRSSPTGMAFVTAGYPPVRPVYAVRAGPARRPHAARRPALERRHRLEPRARRHLHPDAAALPRLISTP